jgi:predicted GNAT family acetyltransferase
VSDFVITEDRELGRFEIRVEGVLAGCAEYSRRPGLRAFTHTRIDEPFGGKGLAGQLIGFALAATRDAGDQVLPFCEFASNYIERHPEHLPLVPADLRTFFDL